MKVKTFIGTDAAGVDKQVNGWPFFQGASAPHQHRVQAI